MKNVTSHLLHVFDPKDIQRLQELKSENENKELEIAHILLKLRNMYWKAYPFASFLHLPGRQNPCYGLQQTIGFRGDIYQ